MDEKLAENVRKALSDVPNVAEVKMFGGIGFMLRGNMAVAVSDRGLLVRVGKDGDAEALERPGASPMVMRGRTMSGYVRVAGIPLDARTVKGWVDRARAHVETLPAKAPQPKAAKKARVKKTGMPRARAGGRT
ncbi:MAG TPA: TfoX/Sxy family protein [Polyangiaceae bacterium]|nr:TfoX/Sxy family protein [Polyangiaceae bacterium]